MRIVLLFAATWILVACATARPQVDKEAVEDFVSVRALEEVDRIRSDSSDSYYELNAYYVIYQTRKGDYLFEFSRRCWELDERRVTPDKRWEGNTIRARFDTLRGCRIDKIFGLTEADAEELKELGEAPGSRN
jgi:hypothetical protein